MDIIKFNDLIDKGDFDSGSKEIAKSLSLITAEIEEARKKAQSFSAILGQNLKTQISNLSTTSKKLAEDMGKMEKKMNDFKSATSNTTKVISDYEKENKKLRKELDNLNKKIKENTTAQQGSNKASTAGATSIKNLAGSMIGLAGGTALIYRGIQGFKEQLTLAIKSTIDFEKAMKEVQAISRSTDTELKSLEKNANKLGATTEKLAVDVANVQKEMAKLGLTASEIIVSTKAIVDLSTATGEDLVNSAVVATSTLRAFGLEANEMGRVVDVMAGSFVRSGLDLEKFRESMKLVAPIARAVNVDIETTTAMLSKLADAGLSGSLAGTALRNLMSSMADPTDKLAIRLGGAVKNSDDLVQSFLKLKREGVDLAEAVQLVDVRARPAFFTLVNQAEAVEALSVEYKYLRDEASLIAKEMRDTLANDIEIATSAFDSLRRELVEGYIPAMREGTQTTTKFIEAIRLYNKGVILQDSLIAKLIGGYATWLKNVNPLVMAYNVWSTVIDKVTASLEYLGIGLDLENIVKVGLTTELLQDVDVTLGEVSESTKKLSSEYDTFNKANEILSKGLENFSTRSIGELRKAFPELSSEVSNNREFLILLRSEMGKSIEKTRSYITSLKDQESELGNLKKEYEDQAKIEKLSANQTEDLSRITTKLNTVILVREGLEKSLENITTDLTKISADENQLLQEKIDLNIKLNKLRGNLKTDQLKTAEMIAKNNLDEEESLRMKIPLLEKLREARENTAKGSLAVELKSIEDAQVEDEEKTIMRQIAHEKYTQAKINNDKQYLKEKEVIDAQIVAGEDKMFQDMIKFHSDNIKRKQEVKNEESKLQRDINSDLDAFAQKAFERDNKYAKKAQKELEKYDAEELKRLDEQEQLKQTIIAESARTLSNITRSIFDNRQILRDEELAELKAWEEEKLRLAGDNEDAKIKIKEEVARREREIKIKQAKDNKAEAMFQIAIDTARGIMATIGKGGFFASPLAMIVAATGALQLAAVATRPIPQFEKGTLSSPEGIAEVGERGRELIIDGKTGQARVANDRQYTHLSKGSVVVPNSQTEQLLRVGNVDHNSIAYEALNRLTQVKQKEKSFDFDRLERAISSIPQSETIFDENGVRKFIRRGNARIERLNKRY